MFCPSASPLTAGMSVALHQTLPSDDIHASVEQALHDVFADKYTVLIDCESERGVLPPDVREHVCSDLGEAILCACAEDPTRLESAVVLLYGDVEMCTSIRGAINEAFPVVAMVPTERHVTLYRDDEVIATFGKVPHKPWTFLRVALGIAGKAGKGAEVLSYAGAHGMAAMLDAIPTSFPLQDRVVASIQALVDETRT
ncbi:hypothetical protein MB84_04895 [Pandoraea oxalativorans]|uniref:Uncharacterized protein n=2 Tax=Pandoraea oxalativorans TaxID=573737 RepID=A0A0E3Y9B2_9BURK|nr:hypothetical protein MB84_04895 [Pandoraea oxalativorans]